MKVLNIVTGSDHFPLELSINRPQPCSSFCSKRNSTQFLKWDPSRALELSERLALSPSLSINFASSSVNEVCENMVDALNNVAKSLGLLKQKFNNLMSDQNLSTGKSWFDADCLYSNTKTTTSVHLPLSPKVMWTNQNRDNYQAKLNKKMTNNETLNRNNCKCIEKNHSCKLMAYNVAGISNVINNEFFNLLNEYDVFILLETHVETHNVVKYQNYFIDFNLYWKPATKISNYGRASGGSVYGIRKSCKYIKFQYMKNICLISLNYKDIQLFILPIYINCTNWETDFTRIREFLETYPNLNFLLFGDANARIGSEQTLPEFFEKGGNPKFNLERHSKDIKLDKKGKQFLNFCEDNNLIILNGRSESDLKGEITFIGPRGCSVIDLACISSSYFGLVDDFQVKMANFSDHLPITVKLDLGISFTTSFNAKVIPLLPKLLWEKQDKELYQHNLNQILQNEKVCQANQNTKYQIESLTKHIKEAAGYREVKGKPKNKQIKRQKWFDRECAKTRERSFALLNLFRQTDCTIVKEDYMLVNAEYKKLCAKKAKQYYKELDIQFQQLKNPTDFWKLINTIKSKICNTNKNINLQDLVGHFRNLLNSSTYTLPEQYAQPLIEIEILDSNITINQIN
jgi:hypothetical protein